MAPEAQKVEAWQQKLEETLALLHRLNGDLMEEELKESPGDREWSATQILAYLRSCQDVWSYSIYAMLLKSELTLAHIHPREWAKIMRYEILPFSQSLAGFESSRIELLRILGKLKQQDWEKSATINGRVHSVSSQIRRMVKHEQEHWPQLESFLN